MWSRVAAEEGENTDMVPALQFAILGQTAYQRGWKMTETMTEAEIEFASYDHPDPPQPKKYGLQSGLACWFCGNPELVSLGFHNRAPYAPGGRKGYHHKERFLCPACGRCSVRVIHVARRRRIARVIFETTEKGLLIVPVEVEEVQNAES